MVDVFISYSRANKDRVAQLARAIEAEGYEVWWDAELPPHESYGEVIADKIESASAGLVVWSTEAAASQWVRAEADSARNQRKLIQTSLGDIIPPLPFNQIQCANIGDWHGEDDHPGWIKVRQSLAVLCGREGVAPPREAARAVPLSRSSAPPAAPASGGAGKVIMFGGIGVGATLLGLAAVMQLGGGLGSEPPAPPPAAPPLAAPPPPAGLPLAPPPAAPPSAPPLAAQPAISDTSGMTFPDSATRALTPAEVYPLGPATLRLARNEIYARHGRRFSDPDLIAHFSQFAWYRPLRDEVQLNAIEQRNVELLRQAEARYGQ